MFSSVCFSVFLLLWKETTTTTTTMIILMDLHIANDHPDGPASCKWSSGQTGLLQMIIRMDRPLANDQNSSKRFALFTLSSSWSLFLLILNFLSFFQWQSFSAFIWLSTPKNSSLTFKCIFGSATHRTQFLLNLFFYWHQTSKQSPPQIPKVKMEVEGR